MGSRFFSLAVGWLVISVSFVAIGCGSAGNAQLRVLHASPDTPDVNVILDGTTQSNTLAYTANTGYISVKAGSRHLQLQPTTSTNDVVDMQVDLAKDKAATVIMAGLSTSTQPLTLNDDHTTPTSGTALVRLVHAAPGIAAADVYLVPQGTNLAGTPTVAGLTFQSATEYQTLNIAAGATATYEVFFTQPGTTLAFLDTGPISLKSGQILTNVALNSQGGGFTFTSLEDLN